MAEENRELDPYVEAYVELKDNPHFQTLVRFEEKFLTDMFREQFESMTTDMPNFGIEAAHLKGMIYAMKRKKQLYDVLFQQFKNKAKEDR